MSGGIGTLNPFGTPERIFVSPRPQDMRAGIQRLASIVVADFGAEPMDGSLYVFVSRKADKVKMLRFGLSGWCLYYCMLCEGVFKWYHDNTEELCIIEGRQLLWLLEGLEIHQPKASKPLTARKIL